MNKDVIYIEPEDDITDIITKIENAKEKIVALVPPKKAGVFRSIVNIKLITKAGASAEKTVVLVTTDPSIIKLAAATRLPVTKNLQSAPVIPESEEENVEETTEEALVEPANEEEAEGEVEETEAEVDETEEEADETKEEADDSKSKKNKKKSKSDKTDKGIFVKLAESKNPVLRWIGEHQKITIIGLIALIILIIVGVWAFVIAPAATLTIKLRTTTANFSENVTFTEKLEEESSEEGKFYLQAKKIEDKEEVEFTATGKKNVGEKAKGTLVVYHNFPVAGDGGKITINAGATFTNNGLTYTADESSTISWDGDVTTAATDCENYGRPGWKAEGCQVSRKINVTATSAGANFNTSAGSGWSTAVNVNISSASITGGTDKEVTVVQQSDIDKAIEALKGDSESVNKEKLYDTLEDGDFAIDSSFVQTVGDPVSTPAIGEEVKEGEKAKLSVTTSATVFVIDKTKVEEFIREKAKLADNFKVYEMNDPFVENFLKTDAGYTGKLKTSYVSGPKVTENDVIEIVKGKGLGVAQHDLKEIDGIGAITINTSFPWVTSIPNNPEKITVILDAGE